MRDWVRLHRRAWREFRAALVWYEAQEPGLGGRLWDDVDGMLDRVADRELPGMSVDTRLPNRKLEKAFTPTFQYTIYYEWTGEVCRVWAIAHQSRRPGYWAGRLRGAP